MKTKVIFRVFPEGDVVALFPAVAGCAGDVSTCSSYMHTGQHGSASIDLWRVCRLATPAEYKPLAAELRRIGYRLDIRKRCTPKDLEQRRQQLAR